jgi:putative ABC transport system permease protein
VLHKSFIIRQLRSTRKQGVVFILCIVLSITTLIALGSFGENVRQALLRDARTLHAADLILQSSYPFAPPTLETIDQLRRQEQIRVARIYEFYSVVRTLDQRDSLLAHLKIVDANYPFYGRVELASGRALHDVLQPGAIAVDPTLLDRLHLRVGDQLHIGKTTLTIRDTVQREPDRPVRFFSFGPRIMISQADLDAIDLVKHGSRVSHTMLLKLRDAQTELPILHRLKAVLAEPERIETFRTAPSSMKNFFDNFLFFLSLIGMFTLVLAGIGMHSTVVALAREQTQTIAILKTLGATNRFLITHYLLVVSLLGLIGTLAGLGLSTLGQRLFPVLLGDLLPRHIALTLSGRTLIEGLILGLLVVVLFACLPLYRLRELKPNLILHHENPPPPRRLTYVALHIPIGMLFVMMVLWQLRDVGLGLRFVAGMGLLIGLITLVTQGFLRLLRLLNTRTLLLKLALKGLFRPGNATRPTLVTLTTAMTVLFSIYLIEYNLDASFVQSFPRSAPNLFFLDIQPTQRDAFARTLGMDAEYYPIITARILNINGSAIDKHKERQRQGDNLAREFRLTYRHHLLQDEALLYGDTLFRDDWDDVQVSVLDTVTEMQPMQIGDTITFKIQGVPLTARVSSIRTRTQKGIRPFFYFVFPESVLRQAPQSIFTAVHVDKSRIPQLQTTIVNAFPNVSVLDVTQSIATFAEVLRKLSTIVRFFTFFSVIAGLLIVISAIFATRLARIREAVYFKILGATGKFIMEILTVEHLVIGGMSALLALILSQLASWIVITAIFDIPYRFDIIASILMGVGTMLLVTLVGLFASRSIVRHKPASFLREHAEV